MIKRTLYFGNPAYLSKKNDQLIIKSLDGEGGKESESVLNRNNKYLDGSNVCSIPIEDIGLVVLENPQITLTHALLNSLIENNTGLITCNSSHMPSGLFLSLNSNQTQSEILRYQLNSSEPLKKQLWQQTISAKIRNQAMNLRILGINVDNMLLWSRKVRSGDPDNYEGRAAAYYWSKFFYMIDDFKRDREGEPPNNLLNYGYAILRAITARALAGSGLLPILGIHHSNKYNAYCLADDIMEPYRPFVDNLVFSILNNGEDFFEINSSIKKQLLSISIIDVNIDDTTSPLMIAMQRTTASLVKCFSGEAKKILYPNTLGTHPKSLS